MSDPLSTNFSRHEFVCRGKNCCGGSAPINLDLVFSLQALRDLCGQPLQILSGFRCLTHNRAIGSEDTSQHVLGNAADVAIPDGFTVEQFAELAEQIPDFAGGGVGRYPLRKFIHVDVRNEVARWVKD